MAITPTLAAAPAGPSGGRRGAPNTTQTLLTAAHREGWGRGKVYRTGNLEEKSD